MCNPKKHLSCDSLIIGLRKHFSEIKDFRNKERISYDLADIGTTAFACMFFQEPSMLSFQKRMLDKQELCNFNTVFKVENLPEDTQIREVLDEIPAKSIKPFFYNIVQRLQRGKHLEKFQSLRGKYLVSIDGTQYFSSKKISCSHCLRKEKNNVITYSHQALQAAIVSPEMKQAIPLAAEDIRNEDGEKKTRL